jgi:ribosomal protein L37AE/L43A
MPNAHPKIPFQVECEQCLSRLYGFVRRLEVALFYCKRCQHWTALDWTTLKMEIRSATEHDLREWAKDD